MSSTANMTRCRPSVLGGGFSGSAPDAAGVRYLVSSSLLWPSGVRIIAMSLRTPSSPTVRSAQRPSTCPLPSSSMPSSVKNATAASRSFDDDGDVVHPLNGHVSEHKHRRAAGRAEEGCVYWPD